VADEIESPEFLELEDVLALHAEALRRWGGRPGVRDVGLLESAVGQARASFGGRWLHPDVFSMAAAYAFHIAENQGFIDGNKRAALGAALMFLDLTGVELEDPDERLYEAMIAVSSRTLDKPGMARLLRELAAATVQSDPSEDF
jgi:death-on-curing protein